MDNNMRKQVFALPGLLRAQYADLEPKTRLVLKTEEIFSVQEILLTGCGDSYFACQAVKYAFDAWAGVPVTIVNALELARYFPRSRMGRSPLNPLVIAVSNSGGVARIGEGVKRANEAGAFTFGITGKPDSQLGQIAQRVLQLEIPPLPDAPGVGSYTVACLALHLLAIRLGEVRGLFTMDEAMAKRGDVLKQADALEAMLPEMDEKVKALAGRWSGMRAFDFIGAGIDEGAARYGAAKIMEADGRPSFAINAEEWLHLNVFLRDVEGTATVLFSNTANPAQSRVLELARYIYGMGRPLVVFGNLGALASELGLEEIATPFTDTGFSMPMTQAAAPALLAGYLSEQAAEEYGRGAKGPWAFCAGGAAVRQSAIEILD